MRTVGAVIVALSFVAPMACFAPLRAQAQDATNQGATGQIPLLDGSGGIIGGRAGHPRIQPGQPGARRPGFEMLPAPKGHVPGPAATLPPMSLDVPAGPIEDGPPYGLTLEQAIAILTRGSLSLRAKSLEIPQARADELTASLRENPFIFADGQLIPYRRYDTQTNPGGPTQYDFNITYPVDMSGKRRARMRVAAQARRAVEAQYQDFVRQELDNLYAAYVDVLAARETLRFAEAGLRSIDQALASQEKKPDHTPEAELQADHIEVHRDTVELLLIDARANLSGAKRDLATVLNLPREGAAQLEIRGSIRDTAAAPPPVDELVQMALMSRPDLSMYRLNVCRAMADVDLARANRFSDVFVLYQPFTYQDNGPFNLPSSRSWALGATVTAPIYDRNQGNIQRAAVNVDQSRLEMQAVERRIVSEVEDAREEYEVSRRLVERIEQRLLPSARKVRDYSLAQSQTADGDIYAYLIAQRDYQELVRQYRDALVRHRRAMLKLNTVVGLRLMP